MAEAKCLLSEPSMLSDLAYTGGKHVTDATNDRAHNAFTNIRERAWDENICALRPDVDGALRLRDCGIVTSA